MDVVRTLQVAFGIGLVIFVHELGHFIAARLCKVRVECFSLGFGPKLFGWRRGPTLYQIALVPLGGFVKMAGEEGDAASTAPDDLRSKSVGQRFFIFSGGVLMNVLFGLIVFPIVLAHGVPFTAPVVGRALPGGPAWRARIEPGTRVLEVNGERVISFMFIGNEVALGSRENVRLLVQDPGSTATREVVLTPRYRDKEGFLSIDVVPPFDPERKLEVDHGSPAEQSGLHVGDKLVGVVGGMEGRSIDEQLEFILTRGDPIELEIERDGAPQRVTVTPGKAPIEGSPIFGIAAPWNRVSGLRSNPDLDALGLREKDLVVSVGGDPILRSGDLERALIAHDDATTWIVERDGKQIELSLAKLGKTRALALAADIALELDKDSTEVVLTPGAPAATAGLRDGDRVRKIDDAPVKSWDALYDITKKAAKSGRPLAFAIDRPADAEGASRSLTLSIQAKPWSPPYYGFGFGDDTYIYHASSLSEALDIGVKSSWQSIVDAWRTLSRIARGDVSSKNIGGIIMISQVSYSFSSEGLAKLFFFLCMLSLNLAFLNVLPIPILDGGHLLFLLIERVKGSPVSERVQGYSQMVGLAMIVSLMIYVTYNDLMRVVSSS